MSNDASDPFQEPLPPKVWWIVRLANGELRATVPANPATAAQPYISISGPLMTAMVGADTEQAAREVAEDIWKEAIEKTRIAPSVWDPSEGWK